MTTVTAMRLMLMDIQSGQPTIGTDMAMTVYHMTVSGMATDAMEWTVILMMDDMVLTAAILKTATYLIVLTNLDALDLIVNAYLGLMYGDVLLPLTAMNSLGKNLFVL